LEPLGFEVFVVVRVFHVCIITSAVEKVKQFFQPARTHA